MAITFNPQAVFRKMTNSLLVPANLGDLLLKLDSSKRLSGNERPLTPAP
jgi:hypothetical protein